MHNCLLMSVTTNRCTSGHEQTDRQTNGRKGIQMDVYQEADAILFSGIETGDMCSSLYKPTYDDMHA